MVPTQSVGTLHPALLRPGMGDAGASGEMFPRSSVGTMSTNDQLPAEAFRGSWLTSLVEDDALDQKLTNKGALLATGQFVRGVDDRLYWVGGIG